MLKKEGMDLDFEVLLGGESPLPQPPYPIDTVSYTSLGNRLWGNTAGKRINNLASPVALRSRGPSHFASTGLHPHTLDAPSDDPDTRCVGIWEKF